MVKKVRNLCNSLHRYLQVRSAILKDIHKEHLISKMVNFAGQKIQLSDMAKRFAFPTNIFHTFWTVNYDVLLSTNKNVFNFAMISLHLQVINVSRSF